MSTWYHFGPQKFSWLSNVPYNCLSCKRRYGGILESISSFCSNLIQQNSEKVEKRDRCTWLCSKKHTFYLWWHSFKKRMADKPDFYNWLNAFSSGQLRNCTLKLQVLSSEDCKHQHFRMRWEDTCFQSFSRGGSLSYAYLTFSCPPPFPPHPPPSPPPYRLSSQSIVSYQIRSRKKNKSAIYLLNEWRWWPTSIIIKKEHMLIIVLSQLIKNECIYSRYSDIERALGSKMLHPH